MPRYQPNKITDVTWDVQIFYNDTLGYWWKAEPLDYCGADMIEQSGTSKSFELARHKWSKFAENNGIVKYRLREVK